MPITIDGLQANAPIPLGDFEKQVLEANLQAIQRLGMSPPFGAFLAFIEIPTGAGTKPFYCGTCAFKGPVRNGRVEISYFTFPEFESLGIATQMAMSLIQFAKETEPYPTPFAYTLPKTSASTRILEKCGFQLKGEILHPEDGNVWEWVKASVNI